MKTATQHFFSCLQKVVRYVWLDPIDFYVVMFADILKTKKEIKDEHDFSIDNKMLRLIAIMFLLASFSRSSMKISILYHTK